MDQVVTKDNGGARGRALLAGAAPAAVALLSVLMVLASPLRGAELGDEGLIALGGWRLLSGQMPYRDFFEIIPPLPLVTMAGAQGVLGVTVWASRGLAILYAVLLALASYLVALRLLRSATGRCAALAPLVSCGVASWLLPSHHWLADLLALAALGALLAAVDGAPAPWAFAAGALSALGALSLQDQGGVLLAALALWLSFAAPRAARRAMAAWFGAGVAAVFLPAALWLLPRVAPGVLFYDWVVFPLTRYRGAEGNTGGLVDTWVRVAALWRNGAFDGAPVEFGLWVLKTLAVCVAPIAALAAFISGARRRWLDGGRLWLMAAGLAAFLAPALRRPAPVNLEWALPFLSIVVAWHLERRGEEGGDAVRLAWRAASWFWIALFSAAGLVRLPGLLNAQGGMVSTPAGTIGPLAPGRARHLQGLVDAIGERVPPGEPLFAAGFIPMVNVLTHHPNPAPLNVFVPPGYTTPRQVEETIAALESRRTRWIVRLWGFSGGEAWDDYLTAHFEPDYLNGRFELWKRKPGEPVRP